MDPLFLSPALPSDLLQFIINSCTYPTTLIICADRADFLSSLTQDILHQQQQPRPLPADEPLDTPTSQQTTTDPRPNPKPGQQQQQQQHKKAHPLLTPHLAQLATTRSIRTVFVPTVTHLRAFLSVFSVSSTSSSPLSPSSTTNRHKLTPPAPPPALPPHQKEVDPTKPPPPRLVVYDFLALHRGSSEWSVQGLGASSAALVEAGRREGVGVVVVEGGRLGVGMTMGEALAEGVPVLSGGGRKVGGELEGSGWVGKTVGVGRVLGRWFRFREGEWAVGVGVVEDGDGDVPKG
ncbi:hypothetical protein F5144DRAFT_533867 [Chaetomium tenue]|uniref:Uncharacterized protein n=1 Tax=Chaetomium tenue TaxID=1854479 RepID=A0ACB7P8X4_9PEZI|nr:hypothetical protein F5144DRAFT_533867 [Chaetomium globosum]